MDTSNCIVCNRKANIHWVDYGHYCANCFDLKYRKEIGVSEKDETINKNFEKSCGINNTATSKLQK